MSGIINRGTSATEATGATFTGSLLNRVEYGLGFHVINRWLRHCASWVATTRIRLYKIWTTVFTLPNPFSALGWWPSTATHASQSQTLSASKVYEQVSGNGQSQWHLGDVINYHVTPDINIQRREKCLRALFLIDPDDVRFRMTNGRNKRVSGTCEWFPSSQEFARWRSDEAPDSRIFWLYGSPGTGKSTMAMFAIEYLEQQLKGCQDTCLTYFFCDSTSQYQNRITALLRGLIYHMCKRYPSMTEEALLKEFSVRGKKMFDSFEPLALTYEEMFKVNSSIEHLVIIDALDESDPDSQVLFIQLLLRLSRTYGVRVMIISRPSVSIRENLYGYTRRSLASFKAVQGDIGIFIEEKVADLTRKKRYTKKIQYDIKCYLQAKAQGTFLWISIACTELAKKPAEDAVDFLQSLPPKLNDLYSRLLSAASKAAPDKSQSINSTLQIIAVALKPMNVFELSRVCKLFEGCADAERHLFTRDTIDRCGFMLVMEGGDIRILHESVKDFLFGLGEIRLPGFLMRSFEESHALMAYSCLDILLDDDLFDAVDYPEREWPNHARLASHAFQILPKHQAFFAEKSMSRTRWLKAFTEWPSVYLHWTLLDVAAYWGIHTILGHALRQYSSDWETLHLQDLSNNIVNSQDPLAVAVYSQYTSIVAELLQLTLHARSDQRTSVSSQPENSKIQDLKYLFSVTDHVVQCAVANSTHALDMVDLLLRFRASELIITEIVLLQILQNRSEASMIMKRLDGDCSIDFVITWRHLCEVGLCDHANEVLGSIMTMAKLGIEFTMETFTYIVCCFDHKLIEAYLSLDPTEPGCAKLSVMPDTKPLLPYANHTRNKTEGKNCLKDMLDHAAIRGIPALHAAVFRGSLEDVSYLISLGCDPDSPDWFGESARRLMTEPIFHDYLTEVPLGPPNFELKHISITLQSFKTIEPGQSLPWNRLGRCLWYSGRVADAIVAWERCISPDFITTGFLHYGFVCDACGEPIRRHRNICVACRDCDFCDKCVQGLRTSSG